MVTGFVIITQSISRLLLYHSHSSKMESAAASREKALSDYRKKLTEHREVEARLKESMLSFYPT